MTEYETLAFWPNQKIRPYPTESPKGEYRYGCTYHEIVAMNKVLDNPIPMVRKIKVVGVIGTWPIPKVALKVDRILRKYEAYQTKVQTEAYNKWLNQNFPK